MIKEGRSLTDYEIEKLADSKGLTYGVIKDMTPEQINKFWNDIKIAIQEPKGQDNENNI